MYIKVWDDKYVIKSDDYCYTLSELKAKEDGEIYECNNKYLNTMTQVFETIVELEGRRNNCKTLSGYIKHIKEIEKKLEEVLEQMQAIIGQKESLARIMGMTSKKLPAEVEVIGESPAKPKRGRKKKE